MTLLLFHELGHFLSGYFCGFELDKISFYPYGGCSTFKTKVNVPLWQEAIVVFMGPLTQCLTYIILSFLLTRRTDVIILQNYHYGILLFNLLPIYPLDGGKILSLILAKISPYKKSLEVTFYFSFLFLFLFFTFILTSRREINLFLMGLLILSKLLEEYKKKSFYYQKFLVERYLTPVSFKKRKVITEKEEMYRDYKHLFFLGHRYYTEQEFLKAHFKKNKT